MNTLEKTLETIGSIFFTTAMIFSVVFVILYAVRSNWKATEVGRSIMWFMGVVASIMFLAVIFGYILRDVNGILLQCLRVVFYGALAGVLGRLVIILIRIQHKGG